MLTRIGVSQFPVDQFVADLHRVCGQFDVAPAEDRRLLRGGVVIEDCAGIEVAHVASDLQRITRGREAIRSDEGENYFLILQEEGRALMNQNDTTCLLHPGDMLLIDSAAPSEFVFFGEYNRQLSLHLPRTEMHARFGYDLIRGGITLSRQDPATIALCAVLAKALAHKPASAAASSCLREAVFGLLGATLHERSGREAHEGIDSDLSGAHALAATQAYINAHYRRPDLSVHEIADDLGLSARQIQRAFAVIGTTPTRYLLQKRLEHARRAIEERRQGRRAGLISSIAYEAGFSDLSYFNRCFRRAFGQNPKAVSASD